MKKKIGFLSLAVVLFTILSFGFNNIMPDKKPIILIKGDNYTSAWQKVDSLENKGLPKSALEIVEKIYVDAKKDNNYNQVIKSFIYKMKFNKQTEEDAFENSIYKLQDEIKTAKYPTKNIMQSMLAEMYWMYYQNNRYKFSKRTAVQGAENTDIKTWDLNKLSDVVIKEYLLSLQNTDSLKRTDISYFDVIVSKGKNTDNLQPTLYDFLAHRAVLFFRNKEIALSRPADKFQLKENFYFADASTFANAKINSNDTLSLQFYGIKILQDLTKFRLANKNTNALIDLELKRLNFVYSNSVNTNKNELYRNALENLLKTYSNKEYSANISYVLGTNYKNMGGMYSPSDTTSVKYKSYTAKAKAILETAVKKYPRSIGAQKCKTVIQSIERKNLLFITENVVPAKTVFAANISYKNIDTVYYKIGKISRKDYTNISKKHYNKAFYNELLKNVDIVTNSVIVLPVNKDYNNHKTEFLLKGLDFGFYVIFMSNSKTFDTENYIGTYSSIQVSNLSYTRRGGNKTQEIYVLNRTTGEPEANVTMQTYYRKYDYSSRRYERKQGKSYTSDKNGYIVINGSNNSYNRDLTVDFSKAKDFLSSDNSFYMYGYNNDEKPEIKIHFFTDRAIYRPGQTVYFKGICIEYNKDERKIVTNNKQTISFYNANYQKISDLTLTTNEFGTFNGSFIIPTGTLNGQFQISTENGSKYIRVEEYKRPKFETNILPFKSNYRLNDEVEITGKATTYSGANLSDAKVSYRITRTPVWRYWWYKQTSSQEIENGTVTSNKKGEYKIKFKALPDLSYKKSKDLSFTYSISVDVTDINGETQSTTSSIRIGYVDLSLSTNLNNKKVDINQTDTFEIYTNNLNGEQVKTKGKLTIYKLKTPKNYLRKRQWAQPDEFLYSEKEWTEKFPNNIYKDVLPIQYTVEKQIVAIDFDTETKKEFILKDIAKWDLGQYKIVMQAKDAYGSLVKEEQTFTVYNPKSNKPTLPNVLSIEPIKNNCEPGENAEFLIGSSEKVKVIYEIEYKKEIIKKEVLSLNNEQKIITIPIEEKYRGNISVHFTSVYNNRFYTVSKQITVPYTNKELDIEFQTFRNKLLPGEKEKWLMTVKGKNADKLMSEMMMTMYDKSLDQFAKNYYGLNIWSYRTSSKYWSSGMFGTANSRIISSNNTDYTAFPNISYNKFNWFGFSYYSNRYYDMVDIEEMSPMLAAPSKGIRASKKGEELAGKANLEIVENEIDDEAELEEVEISITKQIETALEQEKDKGEEDNGLGNIKARRNFNETAFFYPELRTNEKGELVVEFTVPESLTAWKIMGLATTKDLRVGYVENELITQKDLMVMPNPPRFFREGDKIAFPLKISNISDKELIAEYDIQFFDAITEKPLKLADIKNNKITIPAKGNKAVAVMISIPDDVDAIKYRVVAKAGKFSDAEENVIPVLNNRMLVTESLPLPIRGNETKTFTFEKLINNKSKSLKNYKYTLEFTSNPAWYAVQALPYIMEYPYECAEQTFSRFYANSLASHIANSSPKVKAVFDSWKNTAKSEALLSNLEKNQELKALMLEETPWVLQGKNENERKHRIGVLFDLNRMSNELARALKKLKQMQTSNGGWPWFSGMRESRYITQHIVSGMGHLDHLQVKNIRNDNSTWRMTVNAVKYLDKKISEDYRKLKQDYNEKELKNEHISNLQIQYLYARSFFKDVTIDKQDQKAYDYFFNQAKKYWLSKSMYSQAMIALVLSRSESDKSVELDIVKSIKEKSITNEEMGMYWKNNTAGYFWYQAPIETQALMIELFDEVADDTKAVENLKIWLLKQKQTQDWKTTKATSEAIYALLLKGSDLLASNKIVEITLGNKKIDPKNIDGVDVEAGTGYFKTSWSGSEITSDMGKITLSKKDDGVAWGAVYWQYFENLDKITKHKTPLYIEKKLYIEKITSSGKIIEPIDKNKLQVGDKIIVRIELRVDRNMEYVHMKDMRASGFEPINVISRYKWQDGLGYYETTKDASTNFFMDYLRKGTYVFEYPLRVAHKGDFSNGITTIQCMYAPEFTSHSEGVRVVIE